MAVNLGVGATLTDAQVQAQQIAARKAIADALLKQGLTAGSPTVDAGVLKVANFADPINRIINAYAGNKATDEVNADQASLAKAQDAIRQKGINDYFAAREGSVDADQAGPPEASGQGPAPRITPPDRLGAVKAALASKDPLLTQIGVSDLQSLNKGAITPGDIAAHMSEMTPESQALFLKTGDPSVLRPQPKTTTVNGQVVEAGKTGDYRDKYGPIGQIPGAVPGVVGQQDTATGQYKYGPAPGATQNVNLGNKITYEGFKAGQDAVQKGFEQFNQNVSALQNIATAQDALKNISNMQLGPLSTYQQYANELAAKFGFQVPQATSPQQLNQALGENLINVIRKFAPVSDTDAARAMKIIGSTGNTKEALEGILNQQAKNIGVQMDQYQRLVKANSEYFDTPEEKQRYMDQFFPNFTATSGYENMAPGGVGATQPVPAAGSGYQISPDTEAILKKLGL